MNEYLRTWLELYGLNQDPFAPHLLKELNPQQEEDLDRYYAKVEGFGRQAERIKAWLDDEASWGQPVWCMIHGQKGSGCSSIANFVIHHFRKHQKQLQIEYIKIEYSYQEDAAPAREMLIALYKLLTRGLETPVSFTDKLEQLGRKYEQFRDSPVHILNLDLCNDIFWGFKQILDDRKIVPIMMIEKIQKPEQVDSCIKVFENTPLVLLTTAEPQVYQSFAALNRRPGLNLLPIQLGDLMVEDVREFLVQRWRMFSIDGRSPFEEGGAFEEAGIQYAFQDGPWSFRSVVKILEAVFKAHLREVPPPQRAIGQGNAPPKITANQVVTKALDYYRKEIGRV